MLNCTEEIPTVVVTSTTGGIIDEAWQNLIMSDQLITYHVNMFGINKHIAFQWY